MKKQNRQIFFIRIFAKCFETTLRNFFEFFLIFDIVIKKLLTKKNIRINNSQKKSSSTFCLNNKNLRNCYKFKKNR